MKRVLLAGVALLAVAAASQTAVAADMSRPAAYPAKAPVAYSVYDWTGFYIGAQVGYAWGNAHYNDGVFARNYDIDGVIGGLYAGYNAQIGNWVLGLETDFNATGVKGNDSLAPIDETDARWAGSFRARAGYAWDRTLLYVTGGLAYASLKHMASTGETNSKTHLGWTIGAGLEYAATQNILLRGEYRYSDYEKLTHTYAIAAPREVDGHTHQLMVGAAYKF